MEIGKTCRSRAPKPRPLPRALFVKRVCLKRPGRNQTEALRYAYDTPHHHAVGLVEVESQKALRDMLIQLVEDSLKSTSMSLTTVKIICKLYSSCLASGRITL